MFEVLLKEKLKIKQELEMLERQYYQLKRRQIFQSQTTEDDTSAFQKIFHEVHEIKNFYLEVLEQYNYISESLNEATLMIENVEAEISQISNALQINDVIPEFQPSISSCSSVPSIQIESPLKETEDEENKENSMFHCSSFDSQSGSDKEYSPTVFIVKSGTGAGMSNNKV